MAEQTVTVGVGALSIEDVIAVARGGAKVAISDESKHEMALSRAVIDHLADDTVPHYGISTGFGALASTSIPKEQRAQLQKSLIRSHAAGAGPEVEREVVRGLLVLRLSTLCTGRTGVRPETAQVYADMLNAGITPVVYEYGSLGCSGDLAPLAACALVAMGEGEARNADGLKIGGGEALRAAGITPVDLKEKEGLALVNGTDGHARHVVYGHHRSAPAAQDRGCRRRDERGRHARQRPRIRRPTCRRCARIAAKAIPPRTSPACSRTLV